MGLPGGQCLLSKYPLLVIRVADTGILFLGFQCSYLHLPPAMFVQM
ncbi:hypothetical protein [Wolbachia endosymbiont of Psylliodes chrysocephala]|nr:hypothetical protein [Wolbachia endosymbiont of Psylliodes chrysocephala]